VRLERRVEGVQYRSLAGDDDHGGHDRSRQRDPERDPSEAFARKRLCKRGARDHVAQPHDEERCENERHQDPVGGHRHVVDLRRTEREVGARTRKGLHDRHARTYAEGANCDEDVG
jgi:hypothetical protein